MLMDWKWNMRKEESRMTIKFWPDQLGGQNCHLLRWSSLGKSKFTNKKNSLALMVFVVARQILYRINSLSQLNSLIQF